MKDPDKLNKFLTASRPVKWQSLNSNPVLTYSHGPKNKPMLLSCYVASLIAQEANEICNLISLPTEAF